MENYTPQPDFSGAYKAILAQGFTQSSTIISPFPWMDYLILGRSGYSIPWSLTGKEGDIALIDGYGYYTGAPEIIVSGELQRTMRAIEILRMRGDVFVIFDALSRRRMNQSFRHFVETNSDFEEIYQVHTGRDDISVFKALQR